MIVDDAPGSIVEGSGTQNPIGGSPVVQEVTSHSIQEIPNAQDPIGGPRVVQAEKKTFNATRYV